MSKFTNSAQGARGINLKSGETAWIDAGQTAEIDDAQVADKDLPEGVEKGDAAAKKAAAAQEPAPTPPAP